MTFELKLALKYLRSRRKSLARFTSVVAIVGIAVGVASLIVAQSLARGFQDEMREKILANTAHISVFSKTEAQIDNWDLIKRELEKTENVVKIEPLAFQNSILISANTTNYSLLKVRDSNAGNRTENRIEVQIGRELAEKSDLKAGDEAEIVTFANENEPKKTSVLINEIFQTGLYEYDSTWISVTPENFIRLTNREKFTPSILGVSVADIYSADKTADEIRRILGAEFRVIDWQQANAPLFAALSLERKVSFAIISLIIFIAVLNITTTLALLVNERRFDIAILRTCGIKTKSLISVFLFEGLLLGFSGISAGVILGLLGCFLGNYFKIINLPAEVYSLNYIPFRPDLSNVLLIIFTALVLCLAATAYPAFRASRIKPLENLKNN
jgi:lipoprotein-releasing system permease protein